MGVGRRDAIAAPAAAHATAIYEAEAAGIWRWGCPLSTRRPIWQPRDRYVGPHSVRPMGADHKGFVRAIGSLGVQHVVVRAFPACIRPRGSERAPFGCPAAQRFSCLLAARSGRGGVGAAPRLSFCSDTVGEVASRCSRLTRLVTSHKI